MPIVVSIFFVTVLSVPFLAAMLPQHGLESYELTDFKGHELIELCDSASISMTYITRDGVELELNCEHNDHDIVKKREFALDTECELQKGVFKIKKKGGGSIRLTLREETLESCSKKQMIKFVENTLDSFAKDVKGEFKSLEKKETNRKSWDT